MKVYFGATSLKLEKYYPAYKSITDYLKSQNLVILDYWLDKALKSKKNKTHPNRNIKKIYKNILKAIDNCDICIIENTVPNFSVAHQINYSISKRKPTLVLWQKKDNGPYTDSYLEAIESKFLTIKKYKGKEYKKIIDEFVGLSKVRFGQKRYNVVLDNKQRYYLDWAKAEYGKSRSRIIREAVDAVSEKDEKFREYLG